MKHLKRIIKRKKKNTRRVEYSSHNKYSCRYSRKNELSEDNLKLHAVFNFLLISADIQVKRQMNEMNETSKKF